MPEVSGGFDSAVNKFLENAEVFQNDDGSKTLKQTGEFTIGDETRTITVEIHLTGKDTPEKAHEIAKELLALADVYGLGEKTASIELLPEHAGFKRTYTKEYASSTEFQEKIAHGVQKVGRKKIETAQGVVSRTYSEDILQAKLEKAGLTHPGTLLASGQGIIAATPQKRAGVLEILPESKGPEVVSVAADTKKMELIHQIASLVEISQVKKIGIRLDKKEGAMSLSLQRRGENFVTKLIAKIINHFTSKKMSLTAVFDIDYRGLTTADQLTYRKAVKNLVMLRDADTGYYRSKSAIENNAILRKCINVGESKYGRIQPSPPTTPPSLQTMVGDKTRQEINFDSLACTLLSEILESSQDARPFYNQGGVAIIPTLLELEALTVLDHTVPLVSYYAQAVTNGMEINAHIYKAEDIEDVELSHQYAREAAKFSYQKMSSLAENEALALDVGYPGHSMRAVCSKNPNGNIQLNLFDTSGGLELAEGNPFKGLMGLLLKKKQGVVFSLEIDAEQFKQDGLEYLEQIFFLNSSAARKTTMGKVGHISNYFSFMRVLKHLAVDKKVIFDDLPQKGMDCFARRIDAAQKYHLPPLQYLRAKQRSIEIGLDHFLELTSVFFNRLQIRELKNYSQALDANPIDVSQSEISAFKHRMSDTGEITESMEDWKFIVRLVHMEKRAVAASIASLQ